MGRGKRRKWAFQKRGIRREKKDREKGGKGFQKRGGPNQRPHGKEINICPHLIKEKGKRGAGILQGGRGGVHENPLTEFEVQKRKRSRKKPTRGESAFGALRKGIRGYHGQGKGAR